MELLFGFFEGKSKPDAEMIGDGNGWSAIWGGIFGINDVGVEIFTWRIEK